MLALALVEHMRDVDALRGDDGEDLGEDLLDVPVQHADSCLARTGQADGGEVDAVGDVPVFQIVDELICRHVGAVVLRFGRARAEMGDAEDVLLAEERFVGKIGDVAGDLAACDGIRHVGADDEIAARIVDDDDAVLAARERLLAEHSLGVGRQRDVDGDVVGRLHERREIGGKMHPAVDHPRALDGDEGVVADDVHAEAERVVGDHRADRAQTDDAQRLAAHFLSDELSLALFDELSDILLPLQGLRPVGAFNDLSAAQEEFAQDELFHGIGVGAGRIEDDDALLRTFVDGDVVDARARARHGEEIFAEGIVVHREGAKDDAFGILYAVRVVIARKHLVRDGADRVEF